MSFYSQINFFEYINMMTWELEVARKWLSVHLCLLQEEQHGATRGRPDPFSASPSPLSFWGLLLAQFLMSSAGALF